MSYTPTNWQTGDTVTAERLNKMENGIELANDAFVVTFTITGADYSGIMDKTVAEIYAAYQAGKRVIIRLTVPETGSFEQEAILGFAEGSAYPSFNIIIVTDKPFDALVYSFSGVTNNGTKSTFQTMVAPITPMS